MKKTSAAKKPSGKKPSLHQVIINALEDLKAQNIVTLDVTSLTDVTDALVIASGSSNRQVRALAEHVAEEAKKKGMPAMGIEGLDAGDWVLVDFVDIVLHVMQPETREFYDLERLWRAPDIAPASTEIAATATKPASKKSAAKTPASREGNAALPEAYETQGAKARARKTPPKPAASKPAAAGKTASKAGVAKAGVYAKTGTRKPAAAKAATSKPTAKKPAAQKPAAATKTATGKPVAGKKTTARAAIGISSVSKPKKPAARKPRTP